MTIHNIIHMPSQPVLEYAPAGWKTDLSGDVHEGWNAFSIVAAEQAKWEPFMKAVRGTGPLGFNHEHSDLSITEHVAFHNINITYGYVIALATHQKATLSVLDYGGGLGHYYQLGKALLPGVDLVYSCKEVGPMADAGKQINPEINWYTDDSCLATRFDLVMIGGSLQYIEQWQKFLQMVSSAIGEYLYMTGIPVTKHGDSFVAIQHGNGTRMLHWQFREEELLKVVFDNGLTLVREFALEECPYIKNAPSQCRMRGWLFKREKTMEYS
jgi:putative methyltransferase (TIGR04325 family)